MAEHRGASATAARNPARTGVTAKRATPLRLAEYVQDRAAGRLPRSAGHGDTVLSGFVNGSATIRVRVTKPFADSSVSRILELVEDAAARKAPTEKFISCPCKLVISIPLGYFGGIGGASRNGFDEREILRFAALAESHSTHPIARSIRAAYDGEVDPDSVADVCEERGFGVVARHGSRTILAGSDRLLHREGVEHTDCDAEGTVVYVAVDDTYAGYIDNLHAEFLPEEKVRKVEEIAPGLPEGKRLAFVGDGINDAPVLMRADIGIAMGALGSDAAIEAADIVLLDDEMSGVAEAIRIARHTRGVVLQNIALALLAVLNATRTLRYARQRV
jgi:Zn2+/Cd2+-exporting ATPase